MDKLSKLLITCLVFMVYSTVAVSVPASTDYVNGRIKEAVDSVLLQLTQQTQHMESKINVIPVITRYQVGDVHQGGIVFWVDDTRQHGLIVAKMDANQGQGIQWQNGESGEKTTNARSNGLYAGLSNTHLIVSQQTMDDQEGQFAALNARNFTVSSDGMSSCTLDAPCYGNWYLPSLYELQLLRTNLYAKGIGGFSEGTYWTSTEITVNQAFTMDWISGEPNPTYKASTEPKIRPIHAF